MNFYVTNIREGELYMDFLTTHYFMQENVLIDMTA